jgi:large subunit ribosomal protein L3
MKALIGTKLGMTQIFGSDGNVERVTLIEAGPCVVTQIKTLELDGYRAVQLGFGTAKHQPKPQQGHLKPSGANSRTMREIRVDEIGDLKTGTSIDASVFEVGDKVQVTGTSKGKGFAGTIKRHNFHRGPKTHGSHNYRQPGSIGSMYPEHVFKGMRMAGQMGAERVTVKNLKVVAVDAERNIIAISGAVPGPRKGGVLLRGLA